MINYVKALHIIGVAMFFGSILGHITLGLVPGVASDPQAALMARQAIDVATTYLTLPGLAVLLLTGGVMVVKGRRPILSRRWLLLHGVFGLLIVLNAAFFLYPAGQDLLGVAEGVTLGEASMDRLHRLEGREAALGAVNVVLSLAAIFLAVVKPRLGKTSSA